MEALAKINAETAIKHSERMCMSGYDLQEPEITETNRI
jgi:hypothetical protein